MGVTCMYVSNALLKNRQHFDRARRNRVKASHVLPDLEFTAGPYTSGEREQWAVYAMSQRRYVFFGDRKDCVDKAREMNDAYQQDIAEPEAAGTQ